jgi:hypothetical protein
VFVILLRRWLRSLPAGKAGISLDKNYKVLLILLRRWLRRISLDKNYKVLKEDER